MSMTLDWNGKDLPEELKKLPPGRYVITGVDQDLELTEEQEEGLRQALAEADAGLAVPHDDVIRRAMEKVAKYGKTDD